MERFDGGGDVEERKVKLIAEEKEDLGVGCHFHIISDYGVDSR